MRVAGLLAEAAFLEKKKTAQHQADELRVQEELAQAKTRMKIFDPGQSKHMETPRRMLNFGNGKSAIKLEMNTFDQDVLKHHQYFQIPVDKRNTIDCMHQDNFNKKGGNGWRKEVHGTKDQNVLVDDDNKHEIDTNEILCRLMKQQSAPKVDNDSFDGNPLNYRYFMAIFKEVVENRIDDPRGRLIRLIKYTKGEAKELVMNCIHQPPREGYQIAKMLLEKRYGDPHRLLGSYRKEIKEWQQLKLGDAAGFRKFSNFLV